MLPSPFSEFNLRRHQADLLLETHSGRQPILRQFQAHRARRSRCHDRGGTDGAQKDHGEIHSKHQVLCHRKLHPQAIPSLAFEMHEVQIQPSEGGRYSTAGRSGH